MSKQAVLTGALVLLIAFLLGACASPTNDTLGGPSSAQSGGDVPGEKMSDDRVTPGSMGSTNVHW